MISAGDFFLQTEYESIIGITKGLINYQIFNV